MDPSPQEGFVKLPPRLFSKSKMKGASARLNYQVFNEECASNCNSNCTSFIESLQSSDAESFRLA